MPVKSPTPSRAIKIPAACIFISQQAMPIIQNTRLYPYKVYKLFVCAFSSAYCCHIAFPLTNIVSAYAGIDSIFSMTIFFFLNHI